MKIENPEIHTNPFKKSPARKKDGSTRLKSGCLLAPMNLESSGIKILSK